MAKKKKQKTFEDILYTDITTHSLMVLAVFGLVVSGFATAVLGASFVMAEGQALGQTGQAATVALAIDNLVGSSTGDQGHMPMVAAPVQGVPTVPYGDKNMGMASSTLNCTPLAITRMLIRGSRGGDVKKLQQTLMQNGLLASSSITGYFGILTERAVAQWQQMQGIASSSEPNKDLGVGMVGPRTRALFAKCEGRIGQMLSNGSKGMNFDHGSSTMPMGDEQHGSTTVPGIEHMPMIPADNNEHGSGAVPTPSQQPMPPMPPTNPSTVQQ